MSPLPDLYWKWFKEDKLCYANPANGGCHNWCCVGVKHEDRCQSCYPDEYYQ